MSILHTLVLAFDDGELAMPVRYPDDELTEEPGDGTSSSSSLLFSDGDLTSSVAGKKQYCLLEYCCKGHIDMCRWGERRGEGRNGGGKDQR